MSDATLRNTRRGDQRLMRACRLVDSMCAQRMSASERLEAQLGRTDAQKLILLLRRGTNLRDAEWRPYDAAHARAA
jgi:hypothetical protein